MTTSETVLTSISFNGEDQEFWDAVAVYNDPDADEDEAIAAAVLLQQVLMLAQDALTRPEESAAELEPETEDRPSAVSQIRPPPVPQKVIQRAKPGDVVPVERAVELFAERWVLRPAGPVGESTLSAVRDYRVQEGCLQYNASYPAEWKDSAGTISDCPQWIVIVQQQTDDRRAG